MQRFLSSPSFGHSNKKHGWQSSFAFTAKYLSGLPKQPKSVGGVQVKIEITAGLLVAHARCAVPESGAITIAARNKSSCTALSD